MVDRANELGKQLYRVREGTGISLNRPLGDQPRIERGRDIFDNVVPFELHFDTIDGTDKTILDLFFILPPSDQSACCAGCICGVCEFFFGVDPILTTTYPYFQSSVAVYRDDVITTNYSFTTTTTITLGFTPSATEAIKVCYSYQISGCIVE